MKHSKLFPRMVKLIFLLLIPIMSLAQGVTLSKINLVKNYNNVQFLIDFEDDFKFKTFSLRHPRRFILDFANLQGNVPLETLDLRGTPVKKIRKATHQSFCRLVFDLDGKQKIRVQRSPSNLLGIHRLVVTIDNAQPSLLPLEHKAKKSTAHKVLHGRAQRPKMHRVVPHTLMEPQQAPRPVTRDIIVVIDPGHGGKDPGARGENGIREKDVVLAIARKLQRMINAEKGFKAILTRDDDQYLSLRRRLNLAHKYHADMFVAIHADAYRHNRAHGASVYALSARGATSEAARWIAARENESEFVGGLDLGERSYLVRSVLIDLSQTHVISVSLQMGTAILNELGKFADLHHPIVEQAAFVVLKSPDIPSLLVESGFLSNPKEAANLVKPWYQNRIALSIKHGIKSYFVSHPPRGTQLALLQRKRHRI